MDDRKDSELSRGSTTRSVWQMPLDPERYDRRPLSDTEYQALLESTTPTDSLKRRRAKAALARLSLPLHEVYALRRQDPARRAVAVRIVFAQMHRKRRTFWEWSQAEWQQVIGETVEAFEEANGLRANGLHTVAKGLRPHLLDVAYLLGGFEEFGPLWTATSFYPMARVVFAADLLDQQIARLDQVLEREGYATGHVSIKQRHQALSFLLLLNRSPWLDDLSWTVLERAAAMASAQARCILQGKISRALVALGVLPRRGKHAEGNQFPPGPQEGVPDKWYAWYLAWRSTGSKGLAPRVARNYGVYILYAGRWLALHHPGVVSPERGTKSWPWA
jgi:hypothetical protein